MEYTVQGLAKLAGVSARTLRYYDQIGLLRPARTGENGYRYYGGAQVDQLQQILFYRELGMGLEEIRRILQQPGYDKLAALRGYRVQLEERQTQLSLLMRNVEKTIQMQEGALVMNDQEKFEGFKRDKIEENEQVYGKEIRSRYGDKAVEQSNAKLMGLSSEDYLKMQQQEELLRNLLEEAVRRGDQPDGAAGAKIASLHRDWLCYSWPQYSKEAHAGLVEMYVADERFTAYYDRALQGCAAFLREAVLAWLAKNEI